MTTTNFTSTNGSAKGRRRSGRQYRVETLMAAAEAIENGQTTAPTLVHDGEPEPAGSSPVAQRTGWFFTLLRNIGQGARNLAGKVVALVNRIGAGFAWAGRKIAAGGRKVGAGFAWVGRKVWAGISTVARTIWIGVRAVGLGIRAAIVFVFKFILGVCLGLVTAVMAFFYTVRMTLLSRRYGSVIITPAVV